MHPIVTFRMRNNRTLVVKNEMRTVENAKRNERHTGRIRDDNYFKKAYSSNKSTATRNGWRWGLIEKKNKIALIVFNYSVTRVKL